MPQRRSVYRVSVIVPTFHARFLADALASIAAQKRPANEVIVVDDGSPERAHIRRVLSSHPAVRCIEQDNGGVGAARNAGIRAATGDLIALLDADDMWFSSLLSEQIRLLSRTNADLVYSDACLLDAAGRTRGRFTDGAPSRGVVSLESLLSQTCTVLTSSVVARRDVLLAAGLFDPSIRRGQDFDLWLRLAANGASIHYTSRALLTRRVHASGLSGTPTQEVERALAVIDRAATSLALSAHERDVVTSRRRQLGADLLRERAKERLASREFSAARESLLRAHAASPSWKLRMTLIGLRVAPRLVGAVLNARIQRPVA